MARIEYSARAKQDLFDIWHFISEESPAAADRQLDAFESVVALLAEHPEMGRSRDELRPEIRSFPVGQYLILYVAKKSGIRIVRITSGYRDLLRLFRK